MTHEPWSPEEFARLAALPEGHPDRRRAMSSPAFAAWCRMHDEFASPGSSELSPEALADAEAELARRLANARVVPALRESPAELRPRRRWWEAPLPRLAAAAALVTVLGVSAWFGVHEPGGRRVRGDAPAPDAFVLTAPRSTPAGLALAWSPRAGATSYRLVFYGHALEEIARVEVTADTRYLLRHEANIPGLSPGDVVHVSVLALRDGTTLETSPMRELRVP